MKKNSITSKWLSSILLFLFSSSHLLFVILTKSISFIKIVSWFELLLLLLLYWFGFISRHKRIIYNKGKRSFFHKIEKNTHNINNDKKIIIVGHLYISATINVPVCLFSIHFIIIIIIFDRYCINNMDKNDDTNKVDQ